MSLHAQAHKFEFMTGFYSLTAKTSTDEGSKSNFGSYKLTYAVPITNRFEFGLGYTLIYSDVFSGDAAFGIDLDLYYFPFSYAEDILISSANTKIRLNQKWSPFIAGGFHQRQFQSVETQYNGFSAAIGTEKSFIEQYSLKGMLRYTILNGPNNSEANVLETLVGVSFSF